MNYAKLKPIEERIPADRQGARRHYGVHPYFTRRPYNVISRYITHYTQPKDRVLDPFGGSGVTAIEAFLEGRSGYHNDINPLANFIAEGIYELHRTEADALICAMESLEENCRQKIEAVAHNPNPSPEDFGMAGKLPPNILLPENSDVKTYHELFSSQQLISLAILKNEIDRIRDVSVKHALLLAWSSTLAKLNKTFISAKGRAESRGGSSIFSIYRYKVAKSPVSLDPWSVFSERLKNILKAHDEIRKKIQLRKDTQGWEGELHVFSRDVEDLVPELADSIDYILTDPPYGGNISYLDLSLLWNNWLGKLPSKEVREKEIIVGGDLKLTEEYYLQRLRDSMTACFDMLRDNRWLSVIFQHWNINYFDAILSAAEESRSELKSAISQIGDPIWSMHKKKGNQSVMAGEFILTFLKKGGPVIKKKRRKDVDLSSLIDGILEKHPEEYVYGEYLVNMIVLKAWESGAIETIRIEKDEFAQLLNEKGWFYDDSCHYWSRGERRPGKQREMDFNEKRPSS